MVSFLLHTEEILGDHRYGVYDCGPTGDDLVEELAERVRNLYIDPQQLRETLELASAGLGDIIDAAAIRGLIDDVAWAAVPVPAAHADQPPHLDLPRNEVAEVIAYEAAERVYEAVIPAERIREKEVPGQPARGLDLLALVTQPHLQLLLAEVKASSSTDSPPAA